MLVSWEVFRQHYGDHNAVTSESRSGLYTAGATLQAILRLALPYNGRSLAEIGTGHGDTTVALAKACPGSHIFTFDIARELVGVTTSPFDSEIMARHRVGARIAEQVASIRERVTCTIVHPTFLRVRVLASRPYGMLFIDGDHTWRNVIDDTRIALSCVDVDGVIVWDDYTSCPEVRMALDLLNHRCGDQIVHIQQTRLCFVVLNESLIKLLRDVTSDL